MEQVCDRVVILNQGRIVADGSVAEVLRQAAAPREALRTSGDVLPEHASGIALRHLLAAGVPVLEFRMRGGHLSDAFLAWTGERHDE